MSALLRAEGLNKRFGGVQAVQNVDIPIMAAYLLVVSLIFVTINLIVDILYTVVDPRLRSTIQRAA